MLTGDGEQGAATVGDGEQGAATVAQYRTVYLDFSPFVLILTVFWPLIMLMIASMFRSPEEL